MARQDSGEGRVLGAGGGGGEMDAVQQKDELIRLSMAAMMTTDSVVVGDLDGIIVDVNEATMELYGADDKAELIGRSVLDLVAPHDRDRAYGDREVLLENGQIRRQEYDCVAKDGRIVPLEVSLSFIDVDGRLVGYVVTGRDITERRRIEEELRLLSAMVEQSGDSIIRTDTEFRITYVNSATEELFGWSLEELRGQTPAILNAEPLAEEIQERIYNTVSSGQTYTGEALNHRKDGSTFYCQYKVSPLFDAQSRICAYMGSQRDVTERKQAEDEVLRRAAHLAALNRIAAAVSRSLDMHEVLERALAETMALLKAEGGLIYLREASSQAFFPLVHRGISSEILREVEGFKDGEGLSGRAAQTGEIQWVSDLSQDPRSISPSSVKRGWRSLVSIPLGGSEQATLGVMTVVGQTEDQFSAVDPDILVAIGDQVGMAIEKAQLYEAELRRRQVAETLRQASSVLNSTLEMDEVLALFLQQLRLVVPFDSASVQQLREDHMEILAGEGFEELEKVIGLVFPLDPKFPNQRVVEAGAPFAITDVVREYPHFLSEADTYASGHVRSWLGVPLLVKDRVIGMISLDRAAVRPFTAEEAELALALANHAALAIENARLYADLQQQMEELKRTQAKLVQSAKLAAVGELAAGVAHELNNPLTSVLGFAELLLTEVERDSPLRGELQDIFSEAWRARGIVRNLLDFARQTRSLRQPVDLREILQQTLAVIRYHLERSGIVVEQDYAEGVGILFVDEGQMKQVFLNLITNAMQAMPAGGRLILRTVRIGDEIAVSFSDSGVGIPVGIQEQIFDPFFTTKSEGTGLGLSVSLGIVQAHGGRITVQSSPREGSTFTVWLPAGRALGGA